MSTLAHAEAGLTGVDQLPKGHDQYAGKAPQHAGQEHSHTTLDSRDGKSIKVRLFAHGRLFEQSIDIHLQNKLSQAGIEEKAEKRAAKQPDEAPTDHARKHGNEPSKGAKIDEQLEQEEEQILKKKGLA